MPALVLLNKSTVLSSIQEYDGAITRFFAFHQCLNDCTVFIGDNYRSFECPECKSAVDNVSASGRVKVDTLDLKKLAGVDGEKTPWHFKLLVGLLCLYLGWRVVQIFV